MLDVLTNIFWTPGKLQMIKYISSYKNYFVLTIVVFKGTIISTSAPLLYANIARFHRLSACSHCHYWFHIIYNVVVHAVSVQSGRDEIQGR